METNALVISAINIRRLIHASLTISFKMSAEQQ